MGNAAMTGRLGATAAWIGAVLMLNACAPKTLVVLAPSPDGRPSAITVSNAAGTVDIDTPHHGTTVAGPASKPSRPAPVSAEAIRRTFGQAMAAVPPVPEHFVLYFATGSTVLDAESERRLDTIVAAIRARATAWISVVGHTDATGDSAANAVLSRERASAVRDRLVARGVPEALMETTSHGEGVPLVPTPPKVAEPRNRRVEVVVR